MTSLILPGAQSLVSSILADGWAQARATLARRWSKKGSISQQAAEQELDKGHQISAHIAIGDGDRRTHLESYWAGYLAGLAAGHEDLLDAIRELDSPQPTTTQASTVHNSNTGTVGTLMQAGDIHGNVTFGR